MITGKFNQHLEAVVAIDVEGGDGVSHSLEVALDTGFTGYLVLPQGIISRLGLRYRGRRSIILADGERSTINSYASAVTWHGLRRDVIIFESRSESLLGTALLSNSRVTLDVWADGDVLIEDAG